MISLKGLNKTYINSRKSIVHALKDINLELPDKGFILLSGGSGSGKTTLLNILGALDTFDEGGQLIIDGKNIEGLQQNQLDEWRSKHTAFVFQPFNLISSYSVKDNIKLGKNFQGYNCSDEEVANVLKQLKIEGYEDRWLKDLSGGENQRVAIARALVRSPKVLLVDEPTGQVDKEISKDILEILKKISKNTLVICVSHDVDLTSKYADRIISLKKGAVISDKIVGAKKTKSVVTAPVLEETTEKETPKVPLQKAKHMLRLGASNVSARKGRTASIVILSCFALLFFSIFYMLSGYNQSLALAKSVYLNNESYVVFNSDNIISDSTLVATRNQTGQDMYRYYEVAYAGGISGLIEIGAPSNNVTGENNILGQKILYGKYPSSINLTDYEVVITDYLASEILAGNIQVFDATLHTFAAVSNMADIVGKAIYTNANLKQYLKISGIIETDFINLKDAKEGTEEYKSYLTNLTNVYSVLHVSRQFAAKFISQEDFKSLTGIKTSLRGATDYENINVGTFENVTIGNYLSKPAGYSFVNTTDEVTVYDPTHMADDTIILSRDIYNMFKLSGITDYLLNLSFNDGEYKTFQIAAISENDTATIYISDNMYNGADGNLVKEILFKATKGVLATGNINQEKLADVINIFNDYNLSFESSSSETINDFSEKLIVFKNALLASSILLLVFACALIYSFIVTLIIDKKKDIGILRSLGATAGNIAAILFTTVAIIAACVFVGSSILAGLSTLIINAIGVASIGVSINIVSANVLLFASLLAICIVVSGIATLHPILRYSTQTPMKQLKG